MRRQRRHVWLLAEDPALESAVVDALWADLARMDPPMFAALWRRATRRGMVRRSAVEQLVSGPLPV